ncbi:acyl-CoA dehydrogenase family protein [Sphingomonas kyeonggiensis]|uniref:Alkylation response protein AidB-like acyl-CoA dehydrogenase n=1 Tax=Sphingomonas kyeonggiensis TaxID=1268553 RepID=A0A7W6JXF7_9SPHN|nr:acyl-CoA dehydrogenase family protein [Sphingomonas kyeonggiensis]MBB4101355.1 alkylation response protein AidB-like acyl-CoA dehydrogenase [Sphingomonas kyeonggiensis]
MDMNWTQAELAFRDEVRAFLAEKLTPEIRRAGTLATSVYPDHEASMAWQHILHARGWAAPHWPVEHGGCDWTVAQHYIFNRERIAAGAPSLSPMGIHMVAHVIIRFGTPEQKAYFLPRILTGEVFFCQGYSEPGAGSDLASLQMRAEPDGEDFVLNGSKIWTTHATEANWIFCLVRTAKLGRPQQGITFLLVPMDLPGIEVRPILMTSGEHVQNQVFFDNVRAPRANALGEVDAGWSVAKYLLEFERGGSYAPALQVRVGEIEAAAGKRFDDPVFAARLAELRIRIDVLEMMELRLLSASEGASVGALASMMKILGTELAQDLAALHLEAAGAEGLAYQPHAVMPGGAVPAHAAPADGYATGAPWQALAPLRYLNERAGSIYAGSNEIQRNILAKAVLGL